MDGQASQDEARLRRLVDSRNWYKLVPDFKHEVVTSGIGSGDTYVSAARTSDGETIIAYIPRNGESIRIEMGTITGKHARAWWFNPRNGESTLIGTFPSKRSRDFQKPDDQDWILVVDNASTGL